MRIKCSETLGKCTYLPYSRRHWWIVVFWRGMESKQISLAPRSVVSEVYDFYLTRLTLIMYIIAQYYSLSRIKNSLACEVSKGMYNLIDGWIFSLWKMYITYFRPMYDRVSMTYGLQFPSCHYLGKYKTQRKHYYCENWWFGVGLLLNTCIGYLPSPYQYDSIEYTYSDWFKFEVISPKNYLNTAFTIVKGTVCNYRIILITDIFSQK